MEQTACSMALIIQETQSPTMIANDGTVTWTFFKKAPTIF
jgi:hypothetical protein